MVHIRGKIQVILLAQSYAGVCVSRYPNTRISGAELLLRTNCTTFITIKEFLGSKLFTIYVLLNILQVTGAPR